MKVNQPNLPHSTLDSGDDLSELVRSLRALATDSPERQAHVEEIARSVANGTYQVDAEATASAMLRAQSIPDSPSPAAVAAARAAVRRMRSALLSPSPHDVVHELPALEEVERVLRSGAPHKSIRLELEALRTEVREVAGMIGLASNSAKAAG
jgi:anti-sigma28 factor (negative regulator of flagellin synthesis)